MSDTPVKCRRCGTGWVWQDGEWCWQCIHDTCCHRYPRMVNGRPVDCVHGDALRAKSRASRHRWPPRAAKETP